MFMFCPHLFLLAPAILIQHPIYDWRGCLFNSRPVHWRKEFLSEATKVRAVSPCTASEWVGLSNSAAPSASVWPNCSRSARKWSQWTRAPTRPPFDWTGVPNTSHIHSQQLLRAVTPSHSCHRTSCYISHIFAILHFPFSSCWNQHKRDTVQGLSSGDSVYLLTFFRFQSSFPFCGSWWYVFHNNLSLGRQGVNFLQWKGFQEETMNISSTSRWWRGGKLVLPQLGTEQVISDLLPVEIRI